MDNLFYIFLLFFLYKGEEWFESFFLVYMFFYYVYICYLEKNLLE